MNRNNKQLALQIFAVLTLAVIVFTTTVPPAEAFFLGVPVVETNLVLIGHDIFDLVKEGPGDSLAFVMATIALKLFSNSLINWVRTGDFGDPLFVRNWRGLVFNAADVALNEVDTYLYAEGLPSMCGPFRDFLKVNLTTPRVGGLNPYGQQYRQRLVCLSSLINNVQNFENFVTNFDNNGWITYQQLNAPNNNPFNLYLTGLAATEQHVQSLLQARRDETTAGRGYLSKTSKVGSTINEKIKKPGDTIGNLVAKAGTTNLEQIELADEISELVSALIGAVIDRAVGALIN